MTAIELLDETERLMRAEGWKRREIPGCLLSRMYQAAGLRFGHAVEKSHPALRAAAMAIRQALGTQHITMWDDAPGRTEAEVLDAIERARRILAEP